MNREALARLLAKTYGNIGQAANLMGVHRTTLSRKLKRVGLKDERVRVLLRLRDAS